MLVTNRRKQKISTLGDGIQHSFKCFFLTIISKKIQLKRRTEMAARKVAKGTEETKTGDGQNEFAFKEGGHAPENDNLSSLLKSYLPHDAEAFARLINPSLKQKSNLANVAQTAMAGLDTLVRFLQQRRKTCGDQIIADEAEVAFIEKEIEKRQRKVDALRAHFAECKIERDAMEKAISDSLQTMQETVRVCMKTTQKTNSNISKLTKTNVPKPHDNFMSTGVRNKDETLRSNTFRNSTVLGKTMSSTAASKTGQP